MVIFDWLSVYMYIKLYVVCVVWVGKCRELRGREEKKSVLEFLGENLIFSTHLARIWEAWGDLEAIGSINLVRLLVFFII